MGQSVGATGILVLTGATPADLAAGADYVIETLDQLKPTYRGALT